MGKVEACHANGTAQGSVQRARSSDCQLWGYSHVLSSRSNCSSGAVTCHVCADWLRQRRGFAGKAEKPAADVPFFFVIDDRVTYSYIFTAAQPGAYTVNPDGTVNGKTAKSVYSFTHFDAWAYGTNFLNISLFKSDHNDPASPCTNAGTIFGSPANCSNRNLRPVPLNVRLERDLQHQGLQRRAAA